MLVGLSKNQIKEEVPINIICEKGLSQLKASDLNILLINTEEKS